VSAVGKFVPVTETVAPLGPEVGDSRSPPVTVKVAVPKSVLSVLTLTVYVPAGAAASTVNVLDTDPRLIVHAGTGKNNVAGLKVTAQAVAAGSNCDPVTVTTVPRGPDEGESVTILGSTVKDAEAVSTTPALPCTVIT
jgi:hypothetical protein